LPGGRDSIVAACRKLANGNRVTDNTAQDATAGGNPEALTFDPNTPNPARMWNYG
jgi:hypothetical protein